MTTPPKARLYRLSPAESALAKARVSREPDSAGAPPSPAAGAKPGPVRLEIRARRDTGDSKAAAAGPAPAQDVPFEPATDHSDLLVSNEATVEDGFAGMTFPGAAANTARRTADGQPAGDLSPEAMAKAIAEVEAERLSPRQLRVAARLAASHGIEAASDEEAIVRLRLQGIDPMERTGLRKAVAEAGDRATSQPAPNSPSVVGGRQARSVQPLPEGRGSGPAQGRGNLPVKAAPGRPPAPAGTPHLPSREAMTEERRAAEILRIQRDIARRRRRRMLMLFVRLAAFVFLPTVIAGWYYFTQATPLYATESKFQIQKSEGASAGPLGGLLSGTQLATNPDSVAVQSYLGSRDAMMRLDAELGFKRVFQDPSIDPLLRLPPDSSNEEAYSVYKDMVKISYDPTEGVIGLAVAAPDPELSQKFSLALIRYAEGQVDQMTARLRDDQMTGAMASYADAEKKVAAAQNRIQELQQKLGVLDPISENTVAMQQIATLEGELTKKQLELGQLQSNVRPNASRVAGVEGDIKRLEELIADRRADLTQTSDSRGSLASVTGELRIAEGELQTRQQLFATAAAQVEAARIEANKQVRYLSLALPPVPPDEPTYPKSAQNTLVAFLIFAGIYLMLSLTASVLREQVSS
ncbi:capsule biosynthesis protein [Paracoccus suum]|uniref:Capsule biosynthesis protein n=1 Tax=Paracoccus suum TaxID=2259340 RepID=A0A344PM93_9RHOB|nr:capsule biosynthesis protein [Paracoccus suum]AXC50498.1 capsule biosynthesis protein [Paracoccus suum]